MFTRLNADDQYPGSGIGLATCAKIVAYHGGQIRLEDGIDGGVSVVVWLPCRPRRRRRRLTPERLELRPVAGLAAALAGAVAEGPRAPPGRGVRDR